jgi:hypothetical protein
MGAFAAAEAPPLGAASDAVVLSAGVLLVGVPFVASVVPVPFAASAFVAIVAPVARAALSPRPLVADRPTARAAPASAADVDA